VRIFAVSDVHGERAFIEKAGGAASNADMVLLGGDITSNGSAGIAGEIIAMMERWGRPLLAVHGNCDSPGVLETMAGAGISLHGRGVTLDGVGFFGLGGSGRTPMRTPCEYDDDEMLSCLHEGYSMVAGAERIVLVSHTPPFNTRDRTFLLLRAGSRVLREFILSSRVDLCVCGHIHEAAGTAMLGGCLVANTGPFRSGSYMNIEIGDRITVTRGRIR
jgi:Icc-related predicted phosphoesterase